MTSAMVTAPPTDLVARDVTLALARAIAAPGDETGRWTMIDTRRAVQFADCHEALPTGDRVVVPTSTGSPREIEVRA